MNQRLDETGTPLDGLPLDGLHWPQPVALAPDDSQPSRPRDSAFDDRDSQPLVPEVTSAPRSLLPLLVATALSAIVTMSLTIAALYLGGVFASGSH